VVARSLPGLEISKFPKLLSEFERLSKAGLNFSNAVLGELARGLIISETESEYNGTYKDTDGKRIVEKTTTSWIQQFQEKNGIVIRAQTGKLLCSPEKKKYIEMTVSYHIGKLQRHFEAGKLDEQLLRNADETHSVINMDNGRTLGFRGEEFIKYADIVYGGESMTMMVNLSGGPASRILPPMMIFQNANCSYPSKGVPDNIPGVSYRTGKKGWNKTALFPEWFKENRACPPVPYRRKVFTYVDNCRGHNISAALRHELSAKIMELRFFPPNATHLCQPADSFVIFKIKDAWTKRWELHKKKMIHDGNWANSIWKDGAWSGKIMNPGKELFLRLASDAVHDVNAMRDENCLLY
jgi:DDE superfamily endonuclease